MDESNFLTQLEQRTQQVKITLANLEAERVRIEGLINQLQPLVPHYDALVAAERSLQQSSIALDAPHGGSADAGHGEQAQHDDHGGEPAQHERADGADHEAPPSSQYDDASGQHGAPREGEHGERHEENGGEYWQQN